MTWDEKVEMVTAFNNDDIGWRAQVRFDVMKQKLEELS